MICSEKKRNILLFSEFLLILIILALPMLIIEITSIYFYIIFAPIIGLIICLKSSGVIAKINEKNNNLISAAIVFLCPVLIAARIAPAYTVHYLIINILIIFIPYLLIFFLFKRSQISVTIITIVTLLLSLINQNLLIIRGSALTLPDIAAFGTAMTVATNYSYTIDQNGYDSILLSVFIIVLVWCFPLKLKNIKENLFLKKILISSIITFIIATAGVVTEFITYDQKYAWGDQVKIYERGVCYNIVIAAKDAFTEPPEDYSVQNIQYILNKYTSTESTRTPNIILIMNESFGNINNICNITPSEDVMPFLNSLDKNVTKGNLIVPCYGGGTCNSEFEFLTGLTMEFLPDNTFPYMQYINKKTNTLIWETDSETYEKKYIHPYNARNWSRSSIYPLLGFDEFLDITDFQTSSENQSNGIIREYVSDKSAYSKVIEAFENKPADKRIIHFIVTMQNHSPYDYDETMFTPVISSDKNILEIEQYMSLIKISDDEIKNLVEYFSKVDEDTVIVFFGDHLPALHDVISENNLSPEYTSPQQKTIATYSTPFFIWTNYESETEYIDYVSLNYLSLLTKKKAGMSLTQFDLFKEDLYEKYPVFSTEIIIDSVGNTYNNHLEINDPIISDYEHLQYYYLFDK